MLEGPRQARIRGRSADGQSQCFRHRLHGDRHAGAGVRRGGGVQVSQGAAQEHQPVPAFGRRADQGGRARRDDRQRLVHPRRRHRGAGGLSGEGRGAVRGHRLRDRLAVDHQGRAQPRSGEEVRRLGVDREGAGARRRDEAVPDSVQRQRADLAAVAEARRHQAHQLRLREVRHVRRAQAPARAVGQGSRLHRQIEPTEISTPAWHQRIAKIVSAPLFPPACTLRHGVPHDSPPRSGRRRRDRPLRRAARRRPAQPLLQLAQHRVVPGHGQRVREGHRHQGRRRAEGHGRNARAGEGGTRESQGRRLVGGPGRCVSAGGRGRPPRGVHVAEPQGPAGLGAAHHRGLAGPRLRRLRRHSLARLQHRAADEEKAARSEMLEGSARPRLQERSDAGQSEFLGHRVSDAGVAGAGVRRGRGVQVHEGAERQRELLRALRASAR